MLKLLLLGHPTILYKDQPFRIQRRQLRTLLFFLACHPEGISREEILTKFWPEKTESVGRRHLREVLSKLRNEIPNPAALQTDLDRVRLNSEFVYSDVCEYQNLVQPVLQHYGHFHSNSSLPNNLIIRLEQAVNLWRSPGFWIGGRNSNNPEFDNWLQQFNASMELNLIQNLERMANHFAITGEYDRAIFYTQYALKIDEHNEELQEQLLSLLYKAGRIAEAQTFYSYLTELYKREFDDEPPEIIQHTIQPTGQFSTEDQKPPDIQWEIKPSASHHFVGRIQELELLRKKSLQGDVIFITGEAGAGKTRLVQHFFNTLERKPRLFLANCHSMGSDLPLQPLIDMFRNCIKEEDWINLDPQWIRSLSVLVPGVIRSPKNSHISTISSPSQARSVLFEAIRQLFLTAAQSSKILFVLDDAHWCDLGTKEVLMYLVERKFFADHGLCIINSRTEIHNLYDQEKFILNQPHNPITRINLDLLSSDEIAELVGHTLGQTPTDTFLNKITAAAGGNPLFIIETINALLSSSSNVSTIQELNNLPLANSISLIVKEKEAMISDASRHVLAAAAVCGMEFQLDVLELVEGLHPDNLVHCLEELEENKLIQPVNKTSSFARYSFTHNLIREAIISQLSLARLSLLHNKIATAMSASQSHISNQHASVIARHFEEAGRPFPAFRNWVKAGQYARGLFSTHEAYAAFRRADNIRSRMESALTEEDLYSLYSEWGDLAFTVMDLPTLAENYNAMHSAGQQKNSPLLIGAGLSGLAVSAALNLDIERSLVLLEQSIAILSPTEHTFEKIQAYSRLGISLAIAKQYQQAVEMYLLAIELGSEFRSPAIRQAVAIVQYQLSFLYCLMGWPLKAREIGMQSLKNSFLLVSNPVVQSQAHLALAMSEFFSGNFDGVLEHYGKCLQIVEAMQNYRMATLAYLVKARVSLSSGKLGEVWELAQKALKISSENGFFENISEAHCILGDFYNLINNYPKAMEEYQLGSEGMLESYQGMNSYYRLGYVTAMNGDSVRGLEIIDRAIHFSQAVGLGAIYLPAMVCRGMILRELGKSEEAGAVINQAAKEAETRGLGTVAIIIDHFNAKYRLDPGDPGEIEKTIYQLMHQPSIHRSPWLKALAVEIQVHLKHNSFKDEQKTVHMYLFLDSIISQALQTNIKLN